MIGVPLHGLAGELDAVVVLLGTQQLLAELATLWVAVLIALFGLWPVLLVQVPPIAVAAIVGAWLFSIQHRFEDAQWLRAGEWSAVAAAVHGCSFGGPADGHSRTATSAKSK